MADPAVVKKPPIYPFHDGLKKSLKKLFESLHDTKIHPVIENRKQLETETKHLMSRIFGDNLSADSFISELNNIFYRHKTGLLSQELQEDFRREFPIYFEKVEQWRRSNSGSSSVPKTGILPTNPVSNQPVLPIPEPQKSPSLTSGTNLPLGSTSTQVPPLSDALPPLNLEKIIPPVLTKIEPETFPQLQIEAETKEDGDARSAAIQFALSSANDHVPGLVKKRHSADVGDGKDIPPSKKAKTSSRAAKERKD